ncbi:DUF1294 domain-containing protein [Micromonospora zamorensis]|uniref:Uncharacterized protein n=1 Tax=Micromonospora zamorensis TaxID=709883 RepID=A0ABZ1PKI0_9ACTN
MSSCSAANDHWLRTLVSTKNPNFVPALILLGATLVPLTFLTFAQARTGRWQVPASVLVTSAFFGGVIGTVVAGTRETTPCAGSAPCRCCSSR